MLLVGFRHVRDLFSLIYGCGPQGYDLRAARERRRRHGRGYILPRRNLRSCLAGLVLSQCIRLAIVSQLLPSRNRMTAIALMRGSGTVDMKAMTSSLADSTAFACLSIDLRTSGLGSRAATLRGASGSALRCTACESSRSVTAREAPWLLPSSQRSPNVGGLAH